MDFDDTPAEAAFRREARSWIEANAPHELLAELSGAPYGDLVMKTFDPVAESKKWQKKKQMAGWACIHWPKEYGGRGATPVERVIWQQEEGIYGLLARVFLLGLGMCGPTLMKWAREEAKLRYLTPLAAGDEIWCQLFSEPAAGSDLAGLRTRAERDGDDWVVNGQKIWTSRAQLADYGILLARTDPNAPKHAGLTMFIADMKAPGVEVRPIKQINGDSGFNEVYFTDVRIPDDYRLGEVGEGWTVSLTTLMNERLFLGATMSTGFPELLAFCEQLEMGNGKAIDDPAVRQKLATWATRASGLKHTAARNLSALSKGEQPGPENSIGKLVAGPMMQDIATYAMDLQAQAGMLDKSDAPDSARFQGLLMRAAGTRIEGGSDEILRNIIAERVLNLPPDIRADKGIPFNQIPTGR